MSVVVFLSSIAGAVGAVWLGWKLFRWTEKHETWGEFTKLGVYLVLAITLAGSLLLTGKIAFDGFDIGTPSSNSGEQSRKSY